MTWLLMICRNLQTWTLTTNVDRYHAQEIDDATADSIYGQVGGRLTFLHRVAKSKNMLETCRKLIQIEKTWFLNQCWILGSTMDDDVMDQQKWAVSGTKHAKP